MQQCPHNDVRLAIAAYIREHAQPLDKYSHQPRLYALACQLGVGQAYDDDVLYAAAWLHDIGVFLGHRPADPHELAAWDNVAYAVRVVPQLLAQWNFPGSKIAAVVAAIAGHLLKQQPDTVEGSLSSQNVRSCYHTCGVTSWTKISPSLLSSLYHLPRPRPTAQGLRDRVRILGAQVGVARLSPHDCRHYWATRAADAGTDSLALQEAGGWNSLAMPRRYVDAAAIANQRVRLGDDETDDEEC